MRHFLTIAAFLFAVTAFSQQAAEPIKKSFIIKSNLLSLLAKKPTLSAENFFTPSFSAELSFVQGRFDDILFTDHYVYQGVLARAKKYTADVEYGSLNTYGGIYAGWLERTISSKGRTDNTGWFSIPGRNFSAQSIRAGLTLGSTYFSFSRLVIDLSGSIGYGSYTAIRHTDSTLGGYLDMQVWFSVGYRF